MKNSNKVKNILLYLTFILATTLNAQNSSVNELQYGLALKAKLELRRFRHQEPNLNFKISASAGLASSWLVEELYPSINTELIFYNGGIGSRSRYLNGKWRDKKAVIDFVMAFTLTGGNVNQDFNNGVSGANRYVPLYYFGEFAAPSLQNPFVNSFSLGTNLVFSSDPGRNFQRLGFLNMHFGNNFQISYFNDGTPFQYVLLGDYEDRFYTGGLVVTYTDSYQSDGRPNFLKLEASYLKFTGYNQNSFNLSTALQTSNVDYSDENQQYYNKSAWKFNVASVNENQSFGLAIGYYNSTFFDLQHIIHERIRNSYHIVPYNRNVTIEPSWETYNTNHFKKMKE